VAYEQGFIMLNKLKDIVFKKVGAFHINITAGLEDSIISTLSPEWNLLGK